MRGGKKNKKDERIKKSMNGNVNECEKKETNIENYMIISKYSFLRQALGASHAFKPALQLKASIYKCTACVMSG